jgi:hypothetical protein
MRSEPMREEEDDVLSLEERLWVFRDRVGEDGVRDMYDWVSTKAEVT